MHVRTGHRKPVQFPGPRRGKDGGRGQDASTSERKEKGREPKNLMKGGEIWGIEGLANCGLWFPPYSEASTLVRYSPLDLNITDLAEEVTMGFSSKFT